MKKDTAQTEEMIQTSLDRLFGVYEIALERGLFDAKETFDNCKGEIICPDLFSKMLGSLIADKSQDSLNDIIVETVLGKRDDIEKMMAVLYFCAFSALLHGESIETVATKFDHILLVCLSDECRENIHHYVLDYRERRQQKIHEQFELPESPWNENDALQLPLVNINRVFETIGGDILSDWLKEVKNIDLVIMFSGLSGKARMNILSGISTEMKRRKIT